MLLGDTEDHDEPPKSKKRKRLFKKKPPKSHVKRMTKQQKAALRPFEFFALPAEIRNAIYELLVVDEFDMSDPWIADRPHLAAQIIRDMRKDEKKSTFTPFDLEPILASKQMFAEAVSVFFEKNKFALPVALQLLYLDREDDGLPVTISEYFGTFQYQRIVHFAFSLSARDVTWCPCEDAPPKSFNYGLRSLDWSFLGKMKELKTLYINLSSMTESFLLGGPELESPWWDGFMVNLLSAIPTHVNVTWFWEYESIEDIDDDDHSAHSQRFHEFELGDHLSHLTEKYAKFRGSDYGGVAI